MKLLPRILIVALLFLAFAVSADADIPSITIISPENTTYNGTGGVGSYFNITVNWTTDIFFPFLDWVGYELNGASNQTFPTNHTLNQSWDIGVTWRGSDICTNGTGGESDYWFMAQSSTSLTRYDSNFTYIDAFSIGPHRAIAVGCNETDVWVIGDEDYDLQHYDTAGNYIDNCTVPGVGQGITVNGSDIWVANPYAAQSIYHVNLTCDTIATYPLSYSPNAITTINGTYFWVGDQGNDRIHFTNSTFDDIEIWSTTDLFADDANGIETVNGYEFWLSEPNTNKKVFQVIKDFYGNITIAVPEGTSTFTIYANTTDKELNSTTTTLYLNETLLTDCTYLTDTETLTFHMLEEENRTSMNATMEITLLLGNPSSGFTDNYSFKFENSDTYDICIYPGSGEYEVNATIEYYETGYTRRNYFLSNATINNVATDINLYLLSSSLATNVQFLAKDVYHNLQENVVIKAQRFYTGSNEYITVAMGRTGFDGVAGIPLRQNIWYIYVLERDNAVLRTYNPMYLTESELELYIEQAERIEFFTYWGTVAHSCDYNNDSQNLICTFSDTSGKMVEVKLMAEERRPVGNYVTVCENTTVSTSGTLACSLGAHQNKTINYYLHGRFCCSEETFMVMESGILDLHDAFSYGMIGVLITFVLVLSAGMTGIWNPAVSIVLTMVALFASITLQLITVGPAAFMGLVVVAGLIVFKMRS